MKYIDLENKTFTHPITKRESVCEVRGLGDEPYISFMEYSNDIPFQLLEVPSNHNALKDFCIKIGVTPMETDYCMYPYFYEKDIPRIADALNRELSKKFDKDYIECCELGAIITLDFE